MDLELITGSLVGPSPASVERLSNLRLFFVPIYSPPKLLPSAEFAVVVPLYLKILT